MTDGNGQLISGTISMYSTMSDGSGCVAVYSSSYKQLYHIYTVKDAASINYVLHYILLKKQKKYSKLII